MVFVINIVFILGISTFRNKLEDKSQEDFPEALIIFIGIFVQDVRKPLLFENQMFPYEPTVMAFCESIIWTLVNPGGLLKLKSDQFIPPSTVVEIILFPTAIA